MMGVARGHTPLGVTTFFNLSLPTCADHRARMQGMSPREELVAARYGIIMSESEKAVCPDWLLDAGRLPPTSRKSWQVSSGSVTRAFDSYGRPLLVRRRIWAPSWMQWTERWSVS